VARCSTEPPSSVRLTALEEELRNRRVRADIYLVGGAAMLLAYGERPATRDLDGTWEPDMPVREAAWAVAARSGLPRNWLNNQASVYMPARAAPGRTVYHGTHLRVMVAPAEHLLAMKVMASQRPSERPERRPSRERRRRHTNTSSNCLRYERTLPYSTSSASTFPTTRFLLARWTY
jgi:hypothetical protein